MGTDYYNPESGGLTSLLEIMLDEYESDFRECWGMDRDQPPDDLDAADWRLAKALDKVSRTALESVHALVVSPSIHETLDSIRPGDNRTEAIREAAQYNITHHGLEVELARLAVGRVPVASERVHMLLLLVSNAKLGRRAAAYLDRATRLYVSGFDPECIVMSRSILEAALEDRLDDEEMARLGFKKGKRQSFSLKEYIEAAAETRLFSADEQEWADDIRTAGNMAVHVTPGLEPMAFDVLMNVAILIRRLFPAK
jgi:hypothetical protein